MHVSNEDNEFPYELGEGNVLNVNKEDRDFGVIMRQNAKSSRKCATSSERLIQA